MLRSFLLTFSTIKNLDKVIIPAIIPSFAHLLLIFLNIFSALRKHNFFHKSKFIVFDRGILGSTW
jgi:hypothetical protein